MRGQQCRSPHGLAGITGKGRQTLDCDNASPEARIAGRCYSASAISSTAGKITKLPPPAASRSEDQVVTKLRRLAWTRSIHADHVANRPSAAVRTRMPMRPAAQGASIVLAAGEDEGIETR